MNHQPGHNRPLTPNLSRPTKTRQSTTLMTAIRLILTILRQTDEPRRGLADHHIRHHTCVVRAHTLAFR